MYLFNFVFIFNIKNIYITRYIVYILQKTVFCAVTVTYINKNEHSEFWLKRRFIVYELSKIGVPFQFITRLVSSMSDRCILGGAIDADEFLKWTYERGSRQTATLAFKDLENGGCVCALSFARAGLNIDCIAYVLLTHSSILNKRAPICCNVSV